MKIVITGANGLIGWHVAARLCAACCGARFRGEEQPFEVAPVDRAAFNDATALDEAVDGADLVLHFAGINRASDDELEGGNERLAQGIADALSRMGCAATVVYANSIHEVADNSYGRGKRKAAEILKAHAEEHDAAFVDLVLPHIFGEGGKPFYNNVTGTLCHQIARGETPDINPDGKVELVHAGAVAQTAIDMGLAGKDAKHRMEGVKISIPALYANLMEFHDSYAGLIFPDVSDSFDLALFNTYRQHLYPARFPQTLKVHADVRGRLFEWTKGGGGQSFIVATEPGHTRGEHFHIHKVERFCVIEGRARIAMRKVLTSETYVFEVSGEEPAVVDMPTLWTHNLENIGDGPMVTAIWTHDIFDPAAPDTYADKVGNGKAGA